MKLVHLSDLHLGKRVNEFSMLEDQQYILLEILKIIDREQPDGVLIAGDIYDKSVPSAEAVALLDDFLVRLSKRDLQVFIISGNHDSPERIAFGGRLMERSGIRLAPVYDGKTAIRGHRAVNEIESLAQDVLLLSRNTLLVNLRFMDMALNQFVLTPAVLPFSTDGQRLYYNARHILLRYKKEKELVVRDYLHLVFHCVFCHMYVHTTTDQILWDLACDIAVEEVINGLGLNCTTSKRQEQQMVVIDMLRKDIKQLTAEKIYHWYLDHPPKDPGTIRELFWGDDHTPWYLLPQTAFESSYADNESKEDDSSNDGNRQTGGNSFRVIVAMRPKKVNPSVMETVKLRPTILQLTVTV